MAKKKAMSSKKRGKLEKKLVEDKTFGMKNKKGGKAKKYMEMVKAQAAQRVGRAGGKGAAAMKSAEYENRKKKKAAEKEKAMLNKLFETVKEDPKKVEAKKKKATGFGAALTTKKKKKKKKKGSAPPPPPPEPVDTRPIEIIIEEKRSQLYTSGKKLTPVTPESFAAWKKKYLANKLKEEKKKNKGSKPKLSGRQMYDKNASMFKDDESAVAEKFAVKGILDAEIEEAKNDIEVDDVLPIGDKAKTSKVDGGGDDAIDTTAFENLDLGDLGDLEDM